MTPARWESTEVRFERSDSPTGAVLKSRGRVLVFDGFFKVAGMPGASDEQMLPPLDEAADMAPFAIDPEQKFTSPPSRYTEAALVKKLEEEGIGRPSTYASIIDVIQKRDYVEKDERSFRPTDLGKIVTDKLVGAFPRLLDKGYTRGMEESLDQIAVGEADWRGMLKDFYGRFTESLEHARENMTHARAETEPAPWKCPDCGARTVFRFGRNGRFLACPRHPDCSFSMSIDRKGNPQAVRRIDMRCPIDGSGMELRNSRFGPFLASENYPDTKFMVNIDKKTGGIKYPAVPPLATELTCEKCEAPLNLRRGKRGPWLGCSKFPKCRGRGSWAKLEETVQKELEKALIAHEKEHPVPLIARHDGSVIEEGTHTDDLLLHDPAADLELHEDAGKDPDPGAASGAATNGKKKTATA